MFAVEATVLKELFDDVNDITESSDVGTTMDILMGYDGDPDDLDDDEMEEELDE